MCAAAVLFALRALASDVSSTPTAPATATLAYSAPAGCPDRAGWLSQVAARADGGSTSAEELVAGLSFAAAGTSAQLVFHGDPAPRIITGRDCREVSEAAALIVAIAARGAPPSPAPATGREPQPGAALASPALAPSGLKPAPDAPAALTSPSPDTTWPARASGADDGAAALAAPAPPATSAAAAGQPAPPPAPEPDASTSLRSERGQSLRWALGMGVEGNGWLVPWPAAVFDATVALGGAHRGWSARVGASYAATRERVKERAAELRYWGARLEVCPLALWRDGGWHWAACSTAQLGVTRAWGDERSALAVSTPRTSPLAGLELRTRLQAPLGPLRFELEAGLGVPLLRQSFRFGAPLEEVFESPRVGAVGRAGLQLPFAGVLD